MTPLPAALVSFVTLVGPGSAPLSNTPNSAVVQSEKELLAAFKESFASSDPAARAAAVTTLGDKSRSLPDQGGGKRVAQALVKGLEDKELEVCAAGIFQLARGREVDTTIGALTPVLEEYYREIEHRVESSDPYARNYVDRATVAFESACHVLANYKDDRSVEVLVPLLGGLKADTKKNNLGSRLVGTLAADTLELGTEAAVETAVKQTKTFSVPAQTAGAQKLHEALSAFATKKGMTPPEWSEAYSEQWCAWFEANRNQLPKKLGRLTTPPTSDPSQPLAGLPGKSG
jgi:hypothetical protein